VKGKEKENLFVCLREHMYQMRLDEMLTWTTASFRSAVHALLASSSRTMLALQMTA
jgi:hypothetical protein